MTERGNEIVAINIGEILADDYHFSAVRPPGGHREGAAGMDLK